HVGASVANKTRGRDAGSEQSITVRACKPLHNGAGACDVNWDAPARHMRIPLQWRSKGREGLAFVFDFSARKHLLNNLNALAHDGGRANLTTLFALADFFHEDF